MQINRFVLIPSVVTAMIFMLQINFVASSILYELNSTGGSFPEQVYQEATFNYRFLEPEVMLSYLAAGSTTGKCNVMGYWHSGNSLNGLCMPTAVNSYSGSQCNSLDTNICTDACTSTNCGPPYTSTSQTIQQSYGVVTLNQRQDASMRTPLIDFGASDAILKPGDHYYFPLVQTYPALAGASVPIFNIPELKAITNETLIISRQTLSFIFKGWIQCWSHELVLADQLSSSVKNYLIVDALIRLGGVGSNGGNTCINGRIKVIVRQDSSGTSEITTGGLAKFDPPSTVLHNSNSYDPSFAVQVAGNAYNSNPLLGSQTPYWCGKYTDEIHIIRVTNCNSPQSLSFMFMNSDASTPQSGAPVSVTFDCNSPASAVASAIQSRMTQTALSYPVTVIRSTTSTAGEYVYTIGYGDATNPSSTSVQNNWWQPQPVSQAGGVSVTVSTLQEGGQTYLFVGKSSAPPIAAAVSLWIDKNQLLSLQFSVTIGGSVTLYPTNPSSAYGGGYTSGALLQADIRALGSAAGDSSCLGAATVSTNATGTKYNYFVISYPSAGCSSDPQTQKLSILINGAAVYSSGAQSDVFMSTLQNYNNFPWFYTSGTGLGTPLTGAWTCYKRELGYAPWTLYTGNVNAGVVSGVASNLFAIGYSVAGDAKKFGMQTANLINRAGTVVTGNYTSVAFAVMEMGGNLNAYNTAYLTDGASSLVWPLTGYTYFVINRQKHIGNCDRRIQAMEYIHNYYHSSTISVIANNLGFSTLPDFIRDIVVNKMIGEIYCNDGTLALKKHIVSTANFVTSTVPTSILNTYIHVYGSIDNTAQFSVTPYATSDDAWSQFTASPDSFTGAFTVFPSDASKKSHYDAVAGVTTVPFAHHPVVPIYHLNEFTSSACNAASGLTSSQSVALRLRLTPAILAGIYVGSITHWNDPSILQANPSKASLSCLPNQPILVVGLSKPRDSTVIWSRFLAKNSIDFQTKYSVPPDGTSLIDFVGISLANGNQTSGGIGGGPSVNKVYDNTVNSGLSGWVASYLVDTNNLVDTTVTNFNHAIGYYDVFEDAAPQAPYALYCSSNPGDCSKPQEPVDPSSHGDALIACESDERAIVKGENYFSFDLMSSTAPGCYPIAATIDYSIYSETAATSCNVPVSAAYSTSFAAARVKFSAWLYNGTTVGGPLTALYQSAVTGTESRPTAFAKICNIQCSSRAMGYDYCGYRDCSWAAGDFTQSVLSCNAKTMTRSVVYSLNPGSTCLGGSPELEPPKDGVDIPCTYTDSNSPLGIISYVLAAFGVLNCFVIGFLTFYLRRTKIVRRSQPIFIYIFIVGSIFLNLVIISFIGENTDTSCMVRPWVFNIASTLMFAPLVMKLHRVDVIFHNPSLKKIVISDLRVFLQVCALIGVDVVLLILWSGIPSERPKVLHSGTTYSGVLQSVQDSYCNTTLQGSVFEKILLVWKGLLIIFAVMKAVQTWRIPSDIAEGKHFAVAIYNITMFGGICYFLSVFLEANQNVPVGQFLRVLGVFFSCNVACLVIMLPKLFSVITELQQMDEGSQTSTSGRFSMKMNILSMSTISKLIANLKKLEETSDSSTPRVTYKQSSERYRNDGKHSNDESALRKNADTPIHDNEDSCVRIDSKVKPIMEEHAAGDSTASVSATSEV